MKAFAIFWGLLLLLAAEQGCSGTSAGAPDAASTGGSDAGPADSGAFADGGPSSSDAGVDAGAAAPDGGSDAGGTLTDSGVVILPTGTLTVTDAGATCLGGAGTGAQCMTVTVSCPGLPDLSAMIAVAQPAGTPKGTIITHSGGSGTGFLNAGPAGKGTEPALTAAGYRFVQLSWDSDWASTGDIKRAACRPATVFQWIFDHIHLGDRTRGFCGIGSSGGTAAFSYAVAAYGEKAVFDYLMLIAGPTPSRIDYGCQPSQYTGPARDLCPLLPNAPWVYVPGVQSIANGWTGTSTCGGTPGSGDVAKWQADQLLSTGDDLQYPQTGVSFWYCVTTPNESTGQATFFIDQVHPKNDPPDVHCYAGDAGGGLGCQNEWVLQDTDAFNLAMSEMESGCVPNHP